MAPADHLIYLKNPVFNVDKLDIGQKLVKTQGPPPSYVLNVGSGDTGRWLSPGQNTPTLIIARFPSPLIPPRNLKLQGWWMAKQQVNILLLKRILRAQLTGKYPPLTLTNPRASGMSQ